MRIVGVEKIHYIRIYVSEPKVIGESYNDFLRYPQRIGDADPTWVDTSDLDNVYRVEEPLAEQLEETYQKYLKK